jgi:hypothetical protein
MLACSQVFTYAKERLPVDRFGLQGFWFELGERSYMKEPLALQVHCVWGVSRGKRWRLGEYEGRGGDRAA